MQDSNVQKPEHNFWSAFQQESARLRNRFLSGDSRTVFETIDSLLSANGYDLPFELTADGDDNVLLAFSPEGDDGLETQINSLAAQKPSLEGWIIFEYVQPKPVPDAFLILENIFDVDFRDVSFVVVNAEKGLSLKVFSKLINSFEIEDVKTIARTFLWHIIGEKRFMDEVYEILPGENKDTVEGANLLSPQEFIEAISH